MKRQESKCLKCKWFNGGAYGKAAFIKSRNTELPIIHLPKCIKFELSLSVAYQGDDSFPDVTQCSEFEQGITITPKGSCSS